MQLAEALSGEAANQAQTWCARRSDEENLVSRISIRLDKLRPTAVAMKIVDAKKLGEDVEKHERTARLAGYLAPQEELQWQKSSAPTSWRKVLRIHPAADLLTTVRADERLALGEDISRCCSSTVLAPALLGKADISPADNPR